MKVYIIFLPNILLSIKINSEARPKVKYWLGGDARTGDDIVNKLERYSDHLFIT